MTRNGSQLKASFLPSLIFFSCLSMGSIFRFYQLGDKPPWSDEFATLVFSLGNSFKTIPLNQIIPLDILLFPLKISSNNGLEAVVNNLVSESNHPPAFFAINHLWLKLFSQSGELVSLEFARALSTILGILAIPALYHLTHLAFHSRLISSLSAGLMAISPYSIYLSQEARHYTLAILLTIISLTCLVKSVKIISSKSSKEPNYIPISLIIFWIIVNSLGVAVHYFFILVLGSEALVLLGLQIYNLKFKFYAGKENILANFRPNFSWFKNKVKINQKRQPKPYIKRYKP